MLQATQDQPNKQCHDYGVLQIYMMNTIITNAYYLVILDQLEFNKMHHHIHCDVNMRRTAEMGSSFQKKQLTPAVAGGYGNAQQHYWRALLGPQWCRKHSTTDTAIEKNRTKFKLIKS
jgi:hypothetical protein